VNGIDLVDTFLKGVEWGTRLSYLFYWTTVTAGAVIGLSTRRRSIHMAVGLVLLIWSNAITIYEQAVLGGW